MGQYIIPCKLSDTKQASVCNSCNEVGRRGFSCGETSGE